MADGADVAQVLWIEADPNVAVDLPYQAVTPARARAELHGGDAASVVVVGKSVDEPVRLARDLRGQLLAGRADVEILLVCSKERLDALREALRHDPLVGAATRAVVADTELFEVVSQAASAAQERLRHRRTLDSAQQAIDAAGPAIHRPSSFHYAATMWSDSPVGALAVVRRSQHIISANRAATRVLEHDELDLIGRRLEDVLPSRDAQDWSWLSGGNAEQAERVLATRKSTGEVVYLEARVVDVDTPGKDIVLVFLWDVTERVRFEQIQQDYLAAAKRAREAAEHASHVREEVLATVSHDLRGPLQTLLTSSELLDTLAEVHDDATIASVGASVERAASYMTRLVGDLLDIARMEDGGLTLDYTTVDVAALVDEVVELTSGAAGEKNVDIQTGPLPEALALECDRTRVVQLLQNLLNNAVKFSPQGETVRFEVDRLDQAVRFTISDSGPGIDADKLPRLFERFWQADRSDKSGLGLGLAIVRGIVDAHGGAVAVESKAGEGATFRVDLPIERSAASAD